MALLIRLTTLVTLGTLSLCLTGCGQPAPPAEVTEVRTGAAASDAADSAADATYVGSAACAGCHSDAASAWHDSHHDLALQRANKETVSADFSAQHAGVTFARSDDGAFTIQPDDSPSALPVRFTFGIAPLQQYVVDLGDGHLQTFPVPWDSRPAKVGGQRWYALYEGDPPAGDPLHWAGRANAWNTQCADCHSTAVRKQYDPTTRSYETRFAEEDVGCEACHGPGSAHVAAPEVSPLVDLTEPALQVNACAPCHSRRAQLVEGFKPTMNYLDAYAPRFLEPGLYHTDGQILDEVYVYGSFLQSRMAHAGVRCTNCHDPHAAKPALSGNAVCTQCHNEAGRVDFPTVPRGNYDDPSHHLHRAGGPGAACVDCHMPAAVYMGVDKRRDHSFRLPRPDLSVSLGVPNACTSCHENQDAVWAAGVVRALFGTERPDHFAPAFAAADRGDADADAALTAIAGDTSEPIMVRASALQRLATYNRGYTLRAVREGAKNVPLLRLAAVRAAAGLSPDNQWRLLSPLLDDPIRAVRHEAFLQLAPQAANPARRRQLIPHRDAWLADTAVNRDLPETLTRIAETGRAFNDLPGAEASLEEALALQPTWVPALVNLVDIYRATGRDTEGGPLLERAVELTPERAEVHYAQGLWHTRQRARERALESFRRAAALEPDAISYGYALALALNESADANAALAELERLLTLQPDNPDLLFAGATIARDANDPAAALRFVDRLLPLRPGDPQLRQLKDALTAAESAAANP
ncbi:MAG: cytochrome c3 family protein [Pseudomonadota bacterium]